MATQNMTKLIDLLKSANIPVLANTEADQQVDACIEVTDLVSVQIGRSYFQVSRFDGRDCFYHWPERRDLAAIVLDVQGALATNWRKGHKSANA